MIDIQIYLDRLENLKAQLAFEIEFKVNYILYYEPYIKLYQYLEKEKYTNLGISKERLCI